MTSVLRTISGRFLAICTSIAQKTQEAVDQLNRYKTSALFKDRTDVRFLAIIFTGKKSYRIEEV